MKRFLILSRLSALLLLLLLSVPALAEDLPETITLYYLSDLLVEKGVQLPANRPDTYQFPTGSAAEYKYLGNRKWLSTEDDDCLRVSQSGLAQAVTPPPGKEQSSRTLYVVSNGRILGTVSVKLVSYDSEYASQKLDEYLANEISPNMTDMEKVKKLAEIVTRDFDYGYASGYVSMIIRGYGDCLACTGFIVEGCRRLGVRAAFCPEPWESPTHRSALVAIGDELYNIEAGYGETKPRRYTIEPVNGDYLFASAKGADGTKGIALTRYERTFVEPEKAAHMVVPETYDYRLTCSVPGDEPGTFVTDYQYERDLPVLAIGNSDYRLCFCGSNTETISLPGKLEVISDYAFNNASLLHDVVLPTSLRTIGQGAFRGCKRLGEIIIPRKVTALSAYAFADCGTLTVRLTDAFTQIDETAFSGTDVTIIAPYVSYAAKFAQAHSLAWRSEEKILRLPDSLRTVEEYAFRNTSAEGVILPEGAVSIGARAFSYCKLLKWIVIPASVTDIAKDAFFGRTGITIAGYSGSAAETFATRRSMRFFPLDD